MDPAGVRPGSGNRFLYGFYQLGPSIRPPCCSTAAGCAALANRTRIKNDSRCPAGPRPDPFLSPPHHLIPKHRSG